MKKTLGVFMTGLMVCAAQATDYYVAETGNDNNKGSSDAPFATIDKAISTATSSDDVIHVEPGTYSTTTEWGPNLKAKLIGTGASRDDVIIQSAGTYRTLRMADGSMVTNVTVVGILTHTSNADKGGSIEMSGGTLVDCVVRDGHSNYSSAKSGGNIFMTAGLVENCVISNGNAKSRGGNINMEGGTVRNCLISDGQATAWGGNVYVKGAGAVVTNCTIIGGKNTDTSTDNAWGGNVHVENAGTVVDCIIRDGTSQKSGGNVFMSGGTLADCTISGGTALGTAWQYGGGNIYINGGATISRCDVSGGNGGTGEATGGGIRCRNSSGVIEDCLVHENDSGICLDNGSAYNCTVVKNTKYGLHGYTGAYAKIQNCVVFGNGNVWSGKKSSTADAIVKIAVDDATDFGDEATLISASDFADYQNGNYRPRSGSVLIDAGASDPRGLDASQTDLDGNSRLSGTIDIGCYEYQKDEMTVRIVSREYSSVWAPSTVTFTHETKNSASPENMVFTYDFGDDSANETTTELTINHKYERPGIYTVKITARNECVEELAEMTHEGYVRVASSTVYVKPANAGAAFPYDKPETGYASLAAAVGAAYDGYTIYLGEGVYEQTARTAVNKAVTIIGNNANPEKVVLRNTAEATSDSSNRRVMSIENAAAVVSGVTLEGGRTLKGNGGNLKISSGMISNCVIRSGVVTTDSSAEYGMGGGVEISGNGIVTHCVITNNEVRGVSKKWSQGGAVVFPWESTGKLLNCLVAGNRWVTDSEAASGTGSAGITYHDRTDGAVVENCTIVNNTISGLCGDGSAAGVYCVWNNTVRNTVIAGNRQGEMVSNVHLAKDGNEWKDRLNTCVTEDELPSGNKTCWTATLDAMFRGYAAGDYNPKIGGALVNRGATFLDVPAYDLAGKPRVFGKAIDIGCYECQRKPGVVIVVR